MTEAEYIKQTIPPLLEGESAPWHGPDCWSWGPRHYDCAIREIARLNARVQEVGDTAREKRNKRAAALKEAIAEVNRRVLSAREARLAEVAHGITSSATNSPDGRQNYEHPGEVTARLRDVPEDQA